MGEVIGNVVGILVVLGFVYFIVRQIKANKNKSSGGSVDGDNPGSNDRK